jgi:anti-sigma factor (TIGR02949 family)
MTDCGCEKAKAELEEFLHNELSRGELDDIVEHLASCHDCEGEHHVGVVLTEKVRRACTETAPDDLRTQVLIKLRTVASTR